MCATRGGVAMRSWPLFLSLFFVCSFFLRLLLLTHFRETPMYECPSVVHVRQEIYQEFEFDLIYPHIPQNSGSLVLATELSNHRQSPDTSNLTELINLIWALTNNDILIANKSNKTPRADIIISNIKGILKHIVRVKPDSPVAVSLRDRDMIKLLNSGYSPHT